MGTRSTQ
jgi:hypothetical protein